MGLLSIYPTVKFLSWRKLLAARQVPELADPERRRLMHRRGPSQWREADATPRTALERAADEQGNGEGGGDA